MSNKAHNSNGAAVTAAKTHILNSIKSYRPSGVIQLDFAGKNLGLKTGDTVTATKDGVTATFKLGRRIQPKSRYVFEAQPAKICYYRIAAWTEDEPICFFDPHLYLTAEAAFAGIEQAIKETEVTDPAYPFLVGVDVASVSDGIGVFEVSPGMGLHAPDKQVLSEAGQAAEKTLAALAKHQTKTVRRSPPACLVPREKIVQTSLAGADRIMIFNAAAGTGKGQLLRSLAAEPGVAICAPTSAVADLLALDGIKALTPDTLLSDRRSLTEIKVLVIAESSLLDASQLGMFAAIPKLILFP